LGVRKSIQPVKIEWWGVGVVICLEWGADCLNMVQPMPLHPKPPSSLVSFKSWLVLPFWYRLTQVVLEKRPLNGSCISSSSNSSPHTRSHSGDVHPSQSLKCGFKFVLLFFIIKDTWYDTIQDAILTCNQKLAWVNLIYHTERWYDVCCMANL